MRDRAEFDSASDEDDAELSAEEHEQVAEGMARWLVAQGVDLPDLDSYR